MRGLQELVEGLQAAIREEGLAKRLHGVPHLFVAPGNAGVKEAVPNPAHAAVKPDPAISDLWIEPSNPRTNLRCTDVDHTSAKKPVIIRMATRKSEWQQYAEYGKPE